MTTAKSAEPSVKIPSVFKKLQTARVKLQSVVLSKSGHNKFAGYYYFTLDDFLPSIQTIFNEVGLCGVVNFTKETATLDIYCVDGNGVIKFESPMGSATLKGSHDVQNIGAVETYQRRYLYQSAMEIVEHDALDETGEEKTKPKPVDAEPKKTVFCTKAIFDDKKEAWKKAIVIDKTYTPESLGVLVKSKYVFTDEQKKEIQAWAESK